MFTNAPNQNLSKSMAANAVVIKLLKSCKSDTWETKVKLYEAISESVLLYMSEIWGGSYNNTVERGNLNFYKQLLQVPKNTPNCYLRLETGSNHALKKIFQRMLDWWIKLLRMSQNSLPKICYERLNEIIDFPTPFNWSRDMKKLITTIGCDDLWTYQNPEWIIHRRSEMIEAMGNHLISKDADMATRSTFNLYYRNISSLGIPERYLSFKTHINKIRALAQLRMAGKINTRIVINGHYRRFKSNETCKYCQQDEKDDITHFLLYCDLFQQCRQRYLKEYLIIPYSLDTITTLLTVENQDKLHALYMFIMISLKLTSSDQ